MAMGFLSVETLSLALLFLLLLYPSVLVLRQLDLLVLLVFLLWGDVSLKQKKSLKVVNIMLYKLLQHLLKVYERVSE